MRSKGLSFNFVQGLDPVGTDFISVQSRAKSVGAECGRKVLEKNVVRKCLEKYLAKSVVKSKSVGEECGRQVFETMLEKRDGEKKIAECWGTLVLVSSWW